MRFVFLLFLLSCGQQSQTQSKESKFSEMDKLFTINDIGAVVTATKITTKAQEEVTLRNDREGNSFYSSKRKNAAIKRLYKKITSQEISSIYRNALSEFKDKKLCSFDLNLSIKNAISKKDIGYVNYQHYIFALREANEIDDVVAKILIKSHEQTITELPENDQFNYVEDSDQNEQILKLVSSFQTRFLKQTCLDDAYRTFYSEVLKVNKKIKPWQLQDIYSKALIDGRIDQATFITLEQSRVSKLHENGLTLDAYVKKRKMLRLQYPLRNSDEESQFVTSKVKKIKMSRRQKLFESYSDFQIIIMGNLIKTLRSDLESPKMVLQIFGDDLSTPYRSLPLEPMERFRAAIKILRKEMSNLSLNTYFNGRTPEYIDLIVAAYEIGVIPSTEVDTIAGLEEIWNPEKTFWDKANVWINTFGSIATIVIPPPYGFIPALAIVVIQATTQKSKSKQNTEDPTSLF